MSDSTSVQCGPLAGVKVIEMAAIGPVPFCGMVLADMGARVVRVDRPALSGLGIEVEPGFDCMARGKPSIALDLKHPQGAAVARDLIAGADAVIEGFRPGVMERLGLAPETCMGFNPRLVFGRCSGWGEGGPLSATASHDLNLVAMSGALAAMGMEGPPTPPLNLVGDFGGAGMHLACGVLAAVIHARTTGKGQVVSTSIAQGALALMPMLYGLHAAGRWSLTRGQNLLDGGAPFYCCYETADGRYMAAAPIEAKFYLQFLDKLGLAGSVDPARQNDRTTWPATRALFAARFRSRNQAAWAEHFGASDACVTPVLDMSEAPAHPQHRATGSFVAVGGVAQPAPGAVFSATPGAVPRAPSAPGQDSAAVLESFGYSAEKIDELTKNGIVALGPQ